MKHIIWIAVVLSLGVLVDAAPSRVCPVPNLPDVTYDGPIRGFTSGTILGVACKERFLEASPSITCKDGQWSYPEPPCKPVYCVFPPDINPGSKTAPCHALDCETTYDCPTGFTYTGTEKRVCQRNETWTGWTGECKVIICPMLPHPTHGHVQQSDKSLLSATAKVTCNEGYFYSEPGHATRTCQKDETWSGVGGICKAVFCPELLNPQNGVVLQANRSYLANATVVCEDGYVYSKPNSTVRQCQGNSTWSGEEGMCEKKTCSDIGIVEYGVISAPGGLFKDNVVLQCQSGYSLDGPSTIWCQANGQWSTEFGTCEKKASSKVAIIAPAVVVPVLILFGIIALVLFWRYHTKRSTPPEESKKLIDSETNLHCSFTLAEDLCGAYSDNDPREYELFKESITEGIKEKLAKKMELHPEVSLMYLCKQSKTGYLDMRFTVDPPRSELVDTISKAIIKGGSQDAYHIEKNSIVFRERITNCIVASLDEKRHTPDKTGYKRIDIDTQYVRLKLLSNTAGREIENSDAHRPDLYQHGLESHGGEDINDEDLIRDDDIQTYILIRGRAGIGKSTLVQRLLWKWANGEWATQFTAMFLINLRYIMTVKRKMNLSKLLCLYSVYTTQKAGVIIDSQWLEENQNKIGFVMDGIDEIRNFSGLWKRKMTIASCDDEVNPLDWCFTLMKRQILELSTMVVSSRPFADLCLLKTIMQRTAREYNPRLIELMGLTRAGVDKFIEKNVEEKRKDFVRQTLSNNPILMSVSSITFYCAALCELLVDGQMGDFQLTTYTQITAYIVKIFMDQSMIREMGSTNLGDEISSTLAFLSKLASDGLLKPGTGGHPRLVFDENDINSAFKSRYVSHMIETGLLTSTCIEDPEQPGKTQTLNQFIHLSIQEFLAMLKLIPKDGKYLGKKLKKLSGSEQFNMALLFLYGLAFDDETRNILSSVMGEDLFGQKNAARDVLMKSVGSISSKLQAMQIAHESHSTEIAKIVGRQHFEERVNFSDNKLTAIDIIAMLYMLKHHTSAKTIRLQGVDIDVVSIKEIGKFLKDDNNITELQLADNNIDDECVAELMEGIKHNTTLETLRLWSEKITDDGVVHLTEGLTENTNLKDLRLYGFEMGDKGTQAVLGVLSIKQALEISMWPPSCNESLNNDVKGHERITLR